MHTPSSLAPKYTRQTRTRLRGEVQQLELEISTSYFAADNGWDNYTISGRLDNTTNRLDRLTAPHPLGAATAKCTLSSGAHETFCQMQQVLGHKTSRDALKAVARSTRSDRRGAR